MTKLSADLALLLLGIHGHEATKLLNFNLPLEISQADDEHVTDFDATLEVTDTNLHPSFEQTIIIKVEKIKREFVHKGTFDFVKPDKNHPINLLQNMQRKGKFYTRGTSVVAPGPTQFTAQQFPQYGGHAGNDGRVVIYTYTKDGITGVFISEDDNYVAGVFKDSDNTFWKPTA
ncbi:uncharacterized protein FIBRA_07807 [Fibroporia radiculosa]|uniref:Jacalin-type lectin domain-containing protein n=1 Tax=Fibroporia radiculosa TaxID=599839 RepID=J4GVM8_9APHY|nr:uncharacterized protein FIBRA_07807 [Fibroporia radiculosa]CCM05580.1 predicted protein [Fibroporia radiculosa]